ncbi:MAG: GNAT family N-acetyltransferase [Desulfurococcales archaeon]|nr:GNAT family N-acetyltransferase [Desulfurococcales archaeon]
MRANRGIRIVKADESLLERIIEFDRRISWEFVDKNYNNDSYEEFAKTHREVFMYIHNLPGREAFLVADDGSGGILGLSWIKESWDTVNYIKQAYIYDLEVEDTHRGRGIGKLLLEESEKYARSLGLGKISLRVEIDNSKAIKFYLRNGFKPIALIMEKKIF